MLPLSPQLKEAINKFGKDFQAANLPEGEFIKHFSTFKWYKLGQPCLEDTLQELNTDFAKSVSPENPLGPLRVRSPFR